MKILVAGATGLAGSAIVRELTRIGRPVIGISSRDVDLLDRTATFKYLNKLKPNVVIDAAAKVGGINANNTYPVEFLSNNIQIQTNLMDASHNSKVNMRLRKSTCLLEIPTTGVPILLSSLTIADPANPVAPATNTVICLA